VLWPGAASQMTLVWLGVVLSLLVGISDASDKEQLVNCKYNHHLEGATSSLLSYTSIMPRRPP
jgi:hypothetical protein